MAYGRNSNAPLIVFLGILLFLPLLGWAGARIYHGIDYDRTVGGYLKRAADANTVEMAKTELDKAIKAIEERKWTAGSTHLLWSSPEVDVGFWYQNIKTAEEELARVPESTTPLERTNILMKLRETLLDHGSSGDTVTSPDGVSIFPNNVFYAVWCCLAIVAAIGGVICFGTVFG